MQSRGPGITHQNIFFFGGGGKSPFLCTSYSPPAAQPQPLNLSLPMFPSIIAIPLSLCLIAAAALPSPPSGLLTPPLPSPPSGLLSLQNQLALVQQLIHNAQNSFNLFGLGPPAQLAGQAGAQGDGHPHDLLPAGHGQPRPERWVRPRLAGQDSQGKPSPHTSGSRGRVALSTEEPQCSSQARSGSLSLEGGRCGDARGLRLAGSRLHGGEGPWVTTRQRFTSPCPPGADASLPLACGSGRPAEAPKALPLADLDVAGAQAQLQPHCAAAAPGLGATKGLLSPRPRSAFRPAQPAPRAALDQPMYASCGSTTDAWEKEQLLLPSSSLIAALGGPGALQTSIVRLPPGAARSLRPCAAPAPASILTRSPSNLVLVPGSATQPPAPHPPPDLPAGVAAVSEVLLSSPSVPEGLQVAEVARRTQPGQFAAPGPNGQQPSPMFPSPTFGAPLHLPCDLPAGAAGHANVAAAVFPADTLWGQLQPHLGCRAAAGAGQEPGGAEVAATLLASGLAAPTSMPAALPTPTPEQLQQLEHAARALQYANSLAGPLATALKQPALQQALQAVMALGGTVSGAGAGEGRGGGEGGWLVLDMKFHI